MTPNIDQAERIKIIGDRINRGQDTFAGRLDAWHRLGAVTGKFNTWRELIAAAKANFQVYKRQLEFNGEKVDSWGVFRADKQPVGDAKSIFIPESEVHLTFLGTVGKDYTVIQHTDGFDLLDKLVGEIDGAHYETMGTLDYGAIVWGQVDPNVSIRVGDDVSKILLTFHTSHDGSKAFDIYETGVRMVCRNTFRIGSLKRLGASLRVRHTKNAALTVKALSAEIEEINKVAQTMEYKLQTLAGRKATKQSVTELLDKLFPVKSKEDGGTGESSARRDNTLTNILSLYESNDNNAFPEQRGTLYNVWNSLTEYVDHYRPGSDKSSAVFGSGEALKLKTLDELLRQAPMLEPVPVVVRP